MAPEDPLLSCDLVMKGGIASGVVYPSALLALKERYRFRSIGGASAGAIAAGFAGAAELGRQTGQRGFAGLEECHARLGEEGFLLSLFQPESGTGEVYRLALSLTGKHASRPTNALGWLNLALSVGGGRGKLAGGVLGGLLVGGAAGAVLPGLWSGLLGSLCGLAGAGAGAYLAAEAATRKVGQVAGALESNGYGLISGFRGEGHAADRPALTEWIASSLDYLAGRVDSQFHDAKAPDAAGKPLTFEDLSDAEIRLRLVTTNLSQNQPYVLPFESERFVFEVAHFRRLFPKRVVDFMVEVAEGEASADPRIRLPEGYCFLPKGEALPVVVAVRLSLSFPVLLSAVPLYGFAPSAYRKRGEVLDAAIDLQRHWFSDGGISSNFPIHFFDEVLPERPTFGINLVSWKEKYEHPEVSVQPDAEGKLPDAVPPESAAEEGVFIAKANRPWAPDFVEIKSLPGFLLNIYSTSQNFRDNSQARLPSVRDRVVNIRLKDDEGGLNLKMSPETLARLSERGELAGKVLENYPFDPHLWVRFRVLMPELSKAFEQLGKTLPEVRRISEYLDQGSDPEFAYKGSAAWRADARQAIKEILAVCAKLDELKERMQSDPPKPRGHLRITPPL